MPKFQFTAPHNLSQEQIEEKIKQLYSKHGISTEKKTEKEYYLHGKVMGVSVTGEFKIKHNEIDVSLNLPLMAMAFKSKIKEEITKELTN